jgi:hypothetical protein
MSADEVMDLVPYNEAAEAEIVPYRPEGTAPVLAEFQGIAAQPFPDTVQAVLQKYQTVPDEWIDIKPNGQIYLSHTNLRKIYNEAFGYGGWGLMPIGGIHVERETKKSKYPNSPDYEHVTVYREFRLFVHGRFVRQMMGSGDYYTNNPETNYADAVEAAESYALNRSSKVFGIASQCWDKQYGEEWKRKYAVENDRKWKKRPLTAAPKPQPTPKAEPKPEATPDLSPSADTMYQVVAVEGPIKGKKSIFHKATLRNAKGQSEYFVFSSTVAGNLKEAAGGLLSLRIGESSGFPTVEEILL